MEKYLVRGGADPFRQYKPRDLLKRDWIGGNSGNLMFLYGTMNVLTTSRTSCISTYYKYDWTDAEIDEINQTYSAFVIPFADAFRKDFIYDLKAHTQLIRRLKIPCVVVGVGLRAMYEPHLENPRPFDDAVRDFVSVVLDHSAKLGLRGSITGDYLSRLGFIPERHFTVIGCPSLYMHGNLVKNTQIGSKKLAASINGLVFPEQAEFIQKLFSANLNLDIIQQRSSELIDSYYGKNMDLSTKSPEFTKRNIFESFDYSNLKKNGHVLFFLDVPSWIEYLKQYQLFIGSRFHGLAAALLAGVPSAILPFDSRTREFSEYHHIPCISGTNSLNPCSADDLLALCDDNSFFTAHPGNLAHYIHFLQENHLYSAFDENADLSFGASIMEKQIMNRSWKPQVFTAYDAAGSFAQGLRDLEYYTIKGCRRLRRKLSRSFSKK